MAELKDTIAQLVAAEVLRGKKRRYPNGRHCDPEKGVVATENGGCRCGKWLSGKGVSIVKLCTAAGLDYRIGRRKLEPKKEKG